MKKRFALLSASGRRLATTGAAAERRGLRPASETDAGHDMEGNSSAPPISYSFVSSSDVF